MMDVKKSEYMNIEHSAALTVDVVGVGMFLL